MPSTAAMIENVFGENVTGYVRRESLESRLRDLFGYWIRVRVRGSDLELTRS